MPLLSRKLKHRLTKVNKIPLVNSFINFKESEVEKDDENYWKDAKYLNRKNRLILELFGIPVLGLKYSDNAGTNYLERNYDQFLNLLDQMQKKGCISNLTKESRIFEPGCNVGAVLKALSGKYGCEIHGLDIAEKVIEYARNNVFKNDTRAHFYVSDVLDHRFFKQFEDDYFTLSFTSSHLIHVKNGEEKTRYIEHLKRISKSVVFHERMASESAMSYGIRHPEDYCEKYDFKLYTRIKKNSSKHDVFTGIFYFRK